MKGLTRPGLVSRAKQGIRQYRNISINMEYCEGYLRLSSILKLNQFNDFLFGPCGSKWCILYSLKGFANHSTVHNKRKTRKEHCISNWPRNSHRSASKPKRQAQWLKILLVPFNCTFVKTCDMNCYVCLF